MDVAVGVGRAVVEDEGRLSLPGLADLPVEVALAPRLEPAGLGLGQVAFIGKSVAGRFSVDLRSRSLMDCSNEQGSMRL